MELDELENRVRDERDRFHEEIARASAAAANASQQGGAGPTQQPGVAELAPMAFTVNDRFSLRKELAWLVAQISGQIVKFRGQLSPNLIKYCLLVRKG